MAQIDLTDENLEGVQPKVRELIELLIAESNAQDARITTLEP